MSSTSTDQEAPAAQGWRDREALAASPRLFANPLLDRLSRVRWWVPLVLYGPVVLALLVVSAGTLPPAAILGGIVFGYAFWTLAEYVVHRFVFHATLPGRLGRRLTFLMHGVHHEHPRDPLRLVMPALLSAPLVLLAFLAARLAFGLPGALPALAGFLIAYLVYDMTHYYLHHGEPTTRLFRALRLGHMRHHFRDGRRGFGVSAPFWDRVFGTDHPRPGRTAE